MTDVVIVGAGPYGLSLAAYLKRQNVKFRIFGEPMGFWLKNMPKGMKLKSEGFASSLYDPKSEFTLSEYCRQQGLPYADLGTPVPIETFTAYGCAFQRRFVPELENKKVIGVTKTSTGFQVRLEDGQIVAARNVVLAVGLTYYSFVPPSLSALGPAFVSHSADHACPSRFQGKDVVVVGAGASALDLAALLHQAGASVQVVARAPEIHFHTARERPPTVLDQVRRPITGLGPGWKLFWCTNLPRIFRLMPKDFRFLAVQKILGPAPGWFIRDQVVGKVPLHVGASIAGATVEDARVVLRLEGSGVPPRITADHVIAGTGYKIDMRRLALLDEGIRSQIASVDHTPVLSSSFETSVPGLYMIGVSAMHTFGPLLRFAFGAKFAARRVSRRLAA
jgi:thioredoxin reductase